MKVGSLTIELKIETDMTKEQVEEAFRTKASVSVAERLEDVLAFYKIKADVTDATVWVKGAGE